MSEGVTMQRSHSLLLATLLMTSACGDDQNARVTLTQEAGAILGVEAGAPGLGAMGALGGAEAGVPAQGGAGGPSLLAD
ncbi:MAG TPA: hypothetical protein VFZ61_27460, partial [Polyangiales bacterium]